MTRRVKIQVLLTDGVHGDELGASSVVVELRRDLLNGYDPDAAQDWYTALVSALGTTAYREAFPRIPRTPRR
jgi:hypothetical protein